MFSVVLKQNKAFSLLETVVSIAVLAILLAVILQAFSFSIRASKLACNIIEATFLANDKLQELEFKEKNNQIDNTDSEITEIKNIYTWKYSISALPELNLHLLNFYITWKTMRQDDKLEVNTYLR